MIEIDHTETVGWEAAIRGMRNPMNSWFKSDSYTTFGNVDTPNGSMGYTFFVGENDLDLMKRLCKAGTDHRKFMRMIVVYCDITAPLYWWKEFDTYKVGTVSNSCSTMHKIHNKDFALDDFSHEHLDTLGLDTMIQYILPFLNINRNLFIEESDKKRWWQMIQMLPSSYNQKRTVMLNYEVLANIYKSRKNHKLDEWRDLCQWIEGLPYSEIITGEE